MTSLELRRLTSEFLPAVLALDQLCFGGLWTLEGYQRELESPNSDLLILVAHGSSCVLGLGCLWAILDEAHLTIVAVHPNYQRLGFGQAILLALLQSARQRGLERATLEVRISNQSALNLYQKFDFREAGRRKRYYPDTGEDASILWRGGLQHPNFPNLLTSWQTQICDRLHENNWTLIVTPDTFTTEEFLLTDA
ncbi:ribosomal-protein-alanine N-acetyltransferase [Phormidesmis priestleyi ULC007]|uniref:Ribosomal-protein-alanine N-acetyltransferase n=1 Tax=Phormidesmis priestleyi ULC007 TaxID=1920490 RepID=A0A2T1DCM8_9CYAN|nr:ribosomal-protein-alanine N-acetyltransferase [Phormidesmis priestleyi ULC007]PZO49462.1 MAG: ribosomal-protein-alanine N-acetyltransferase [Phormidesmis priestleyi]